MKTFIYKLRLTLQGPIFSSAQGGRRFGLDQPMLRNDNGKPALAGTLLRGNLRHSWNELKKYGLEIDVDYWLGAPDSQRSRLQFSHWFPADKFDHTSRLIPRIKIDENGTAEEHMLQFIEAPFDVGDHVTFAGEIVAKLSEHQNPETLANQIEKGFNWVPALGGFKAIGFGRVTGIKVSFTERRTSPPIQLNSDQFGIALNFDRPICFAKPQSGKTANNLFISENHIPGAAILAVLAANWPENLKAALNYVHISHALPGTAEGRRPVPPPLSLVHVDNHFYNMAEAHVPLPKTSAPKFQTDWKRKEHEQIKKLFPYPQLNRTLETHTSINPISNTAADSELFSLEMVETSELRWLANVDISRVPSTNRDAVRKELLTQFTNGLAPLGKTDASASVTVSSLHSLSTSLKNFTNLESPQIAVTLITDAHLIEPIPAHSVIRKPDDWLAEYQRVIEKLSASTLNVIKIFTEEKLVGGQFFHHRFNTNGHYKPRLLTAAGSVLVLEVKQLDEGFKHLNNWFQFGLPPVGGSDWKTNPYLPQNGYGEIAALKNLGRVNQ
ncbi:RAMP superfamily CRISPR-associated protein [Teredinibacter turnerae]|uniref:RAMP superfamily CRISPR-associated protein n=1 Tax=Teredinibacter turnerae TaxID=2426 RepID=UPI00035D4E50|nr:RAMP superfamily CRISPR-associated protein [Teredinibacter turnerae]